MSRIYAEPTPKQTSAVQSAAVPAKPNEEFMLGWRPEQWDLVEYASVGKDGKRGKPALKWMPRLSQIPLTRGVNGIQGDAEGRDPSTFAGRYVGSGGVLFRTGDKRLGPYANFVYEVKCQHRNRIGTLHLTPWDRPVVLNGRTRFEVDVMGWRDLLQYLMDSDLVEPMSEFVLMDLEDRQRNRIAQMRQRPASSYGLAEKIKAEEDKLTAMRAAWEKQFGGAA